MKYFEPGKNNAEAAMRRLSHQVQFHRHSHFLSLVLGERSPVSDEVQAKALEYEVKKKSRIQCGAGIAAAQTAGAQCQAKKTIFEDC